MAIITWKQLHEEIFMKFSNDTTANTEKDFFEVFFSNNLYQYLFYPNDLFDSNLLSALYHATDDAKPAFDAMANYLISEDKQNTKKTKSFNNSQISHFKTKWETYLPFMIHKKLLKTDDTLFSPKLIGFRTTVRKLISDIKTNSSNPAEEKTADYLQMLFSEREYSKILAVLSVIASSITYFEEESETASKLQQIVLSDMHDSKYSTLNSSTLQITFEILDNDIIHYFRTTKELNSFTDSDYQEDFAITRAVILNLMPYDLQVKSCGQKSNPDEISKKYCGIVYHATNDAMNRFENASKYILNLRNKSGEYYRYDTCPVILDFQKNWERLIPESAYSAHTEAGLTDGQKQRLSLLKACVDEVLACLKETDCLTISMRLESLLSDNKPYSTVLAILSTIASTLFYFAPKNNTYSNDTKLLHSIILPPLPEIQRMECLSRASKLIDNHSVSLQELQQLLQPALQNSLQKGEANFLLYEKAVEQNVLRQADAFLRQAEICRYLPAIQVVSTKTADKLLSEINALWESNSMEDSIKNCERSLITECCQKSEQILSLPEFYDSEITGKAAYILYVCIFHDRYTSPTKNTANYYLKLSHNKGYEPAIKIWKSINNSSITPVIERSSLSSEGICYINAKNSCSSMFEQTIPLNWKSFYFNSEFETESNHCILNSNLFDNTEHKFLFVDDDFHKNLIQLFKLLQFVNKESSSLKNHFNWKIYIRHNSENAHSLIDTARNVISQYQIPIYIINDSKVAAQQLLSQHPLFFPVRSLKWSDSNHMEKEKTVLSFIIVGASDVAEWLIRESFWMMGFRKNAIKAKIILLDEHASACINQIKGKYSGMANNSSQNIAGVDLPEIIGQDTILGSFDMMEKIRTLFTENRYCYFATATDSDDENLTLAVRIREALVRTAIDTQNGSMLDSMPPVAFYCKDDQISWLSKYMVIEKEEHGRQWFNSYSLIPYGKLADTYSFDNIGGGAFDLLAKCIHYEYSGIQPEDIIAGTKESQDSTFDFYKRQYNQESSFSIALSMPYRLFQFEDQFSNHIYPNGWDICDDTVFSSVQQLDNLAAKLPQNYETQNNLITEIAEWEHARWVRWMLSRGWITATSDSAVFAFEKGNPRQQLFASKQHPCIAAYSDLDILTRILKENCGLNKNFYDYDKKNIRSTRDLLSLKWITELTHTPPASDINER